jgi:hypothetical protein
MTIDLADCLESAYAAAPTGKRTFGDRARDILSVKDFGAVGDGVTDDTAAIQACVDEAHTVSGDAFWLNRPVYFPRGNYRITDTITFYRCYYAWVFGDGPGATTITWDGVGTEEVAPLRTTDEYDPGEYVAPAMFFFDGGNRSTFENMSFNGGDGANKACYGIQADSAPANANFLTGNAYYNLDFRNIGIICPSGLPIGYGIACGFLPYDGASEQHCFDCSFTDCTHGFAMGNQNALGDMVVGCKFTRCYVGIWENTVGIPTIMGCTFKDSYWGDIRSNSDVGIIIGCHSTTSQPYVTPHWPVPNPYGYQVGPDYPGPSFVCFSASYTRYIASCTHQADQTTNTSYFVHSIGSEVVDNCKSNKGYRTQGVSNPAAAAASTSHLAALRGNTLGTTVGDVAEEI